MACATVKAKNAAFVTLLVFDTHEEKVPSEDTLFRVEMSDGEFRRTYRKEAEQLIANIQIKVTVYDICTKETTNTCLTDDTSKTAAEAKQTKSHVLDD